MFKSKKYPQELMEMIIIDDGKDNISDLFEKVQVILNISDMKKIIFK